MPLRRGRSRFSDIDTRLAKERATAAARETMELRKKLATVTEQRDEAVGLLQRLVREFRARIGGMYANEHYGFIRKDDMADVQRFLAARDGGEGEG